MNSKINKFFFNIRFLAVLHKRNFSTYFKKKKIAKCHDIRPNSVHWFGHATTIINMDENIIVTDPVIGSLGQFRRLIKNSLNIKSVPINYIVLSHGHMDHIDFLSLLKLNKNVIVIAPKFYVNPLKMLGYKNVIGLNAYEQYKDENISIKAFPANHDGRRYYIGKAYNSNSYLITSKNKKVFFAGDTAYTENFKDIECDLALMPVGCYKPDGFEKMHCSPKQSFEMFKMMKSKLMVPIHYDTFILSLDTVEEILETLHNINDGSIKIISVGETINI